MSINCKEIGLFLVPVYDAVNYWGKNKGMWKRGWKKDKRRIKWGMGTRIAYSAAFLIGLPTYLTINYLSGKSLDERREAFSSKVESLDRKKTEKLEDLQEINE